MTEATAKAAAQAGAAESGRGLLSVPGADVWLAAAVHDLQDPLKTAHTYLKGIEDRFMEMLPLVARKNVTAALQAIQQSQELVAQTLACASAEDIDPHPIPLADVMQEVQAALATRIEGGAATLEVRSLPTIHADPGGVRRVLQNLVGNSARHAGGPVQVTLSASRERSGWWVVVADDGPGIPEEKRADLWHVDGLRTDAGGVGLALCHRIVEAHGGRIECDCPEGGGTVMRVFWPDKPGRRSAAGRRKAD